MRGRDKAVGSSNACRIDASALPFAPDVFDVVILNGVLEWVPDASDENPQEVQLRTLREIERVLTPSGLLYMGIEPRFHAKYLAGMRDHSGLRFAAVLPRQIANAYSRVVRGRGYKNYLYTVGGYRKLLERSGFEGVEPAAALPSYKVPQSIVPFDEFDEIRTTIASIDEPRWRRSIRKILSVHPALFGLCGTELVFVASPKDNSSP